MATPQNNIRKTNRPTGLELDRYKGHENWSYRRWAWEFLRRDVDFIKACEAVDRKEREVIAVAAEFHLSQFKHYKKGFKSKSEVAPKFSARTIQSIKNIEGVDPENRTIAIRTRLQPGQVLLIFNINHECIVHGSIKAQLRVAKKVLNDSFSAYTRNQNRGAKKENRPQMKNLVDLLRNLDAEASHETLIQGMERLHPEKFASLESEEKSKEAWKLMRTARKYAKEVYLSLAVHEAKLKTIKKK